MCLFLHRNLFGQTWGFWFCPQPCCTDAQGSGMPLLSGVSCADSHIRAGMPSLPLRPWPPTRHLLGPEQQTWCPEGRAWALWVGLQLCGHGHAAVPGCYVTMGRGFRVMRSGGGDSLLFLPQGSCWEQPCEICSPTTAHPFLSPQVLGESTALLGMLLWGSKPSWKEPSPSQDKMGSAEPKPREAGLSRAKYCQPQLGPAVRGQAGQCGQSGHCGQWGLVSHSLLLSLAQQQGEPATRNIHHHDCMTQRSCRTKSKVEHPLCVKHLRFCTFLLLISSFLCISHSIALCFQ